MIESVGQAPVWLVTSAVFFCCLLFSSLIFWAVFKLWKSWHLEVSPGFFTPISVVFGLIVGFLASQIWADNNRAFTAVMREASALKSIVAVSEAFPDQTRESTKQLVRNYIDNAVNVEWPEMRGSHSFNGLVDNSDKRYLSYVLLIKPNNETEASAKQQLFSAFKALHEARDERLLLSGTSVNSLKWSVVVALAMILLIVTALVHRSNPRSAALSLAVLSSVISLCFVLILTHDRPFTGYISITPDLLISAKP